MKQNFLIKILMSIFNGNQSRRGFTLPEVLIAMTLTAIVMAIVVPNLIYSFTDYSNRVKLKADYKMLQEATDQVVSFHQGSLKGAYSSITNADKVLGDYEQYLKFTRDCPSTGTALRGNCWQTDNNWRLYNNSSGTSSAADSGLILKNGSYVKFELTNTSCGDTQTYTDASTSFGDGASASSINRCGFIAIDTNGKQGPNVVGKDIFFFHLTSLKLLPISTADSSTSGSSYEYLIGK